MINDVIVDPKDRYVRASRYARAHGLEPRHLMALRKRFPDAWPREYLRANTSFFIRERDLDSFLAECARREAEMAEPFSANQAKGLEVRRRNAAARRAAA